MVLTQTSVEKNQTTSSFAKARDIPRMLQDFSSTRIAVAIISRWWYEGMSDQIQKWAPEFQATPIKWCQVLKNEVLEKSNTRFPAPPIKNDLTQTLHDNHWSVFWTFCQSLLSLFTLVHTCVQTVPGTCETFYSVCFPDSSSDVPIQIEGNFQL